MLLSDITSSTLVALTLTETIGLLVFIVTVMVSVSAFVRKDERDKARLDQVEKENASMKLDLKHLIEQVDRMAGAISLLTRQLQGRARQSKTKPTTP